MKISIGDAVFELQIEEGYTSTLEKKSNGSVVTVAQGLRKLYEIHLKYTIANGLTWEVFDFSMRRPTSRDQGQTNIPATLSLIEDKIQVLEQEKDNEKPKEIGFTNIDFGQAAPEQVAA